MKPTNYKKTGTAATEIARFQLAADKSSDQIIITDASGFIIYANEATKLFSGYRPEEITGKRIEDLRFWGGYMGKYIYWQLWHTVKRDMQAFTAETINQRKNRSKYITELRIFPIIGRSRKVKYLVGLEKNITAEKEVDQTKNEFITLASHHFRTPLTNISLSIEILLRDPTGHLSEQQRNSLIGIYHDIHDMADLIGTLLDVSKIQLGSFVVTPKPVELNETAEIALNQVIPEIHSKNLQLIRKFEPDLPVILSDKNILKTILNNLLTNAVKYTLEGGTVVFKIKRQENNILVEVSDSSCGIPAEEPDRIFTKFFRARNAKRIEAQGTGLGLYLTKLLLKSIRGRISFKSLENKGTSFFVSIPLLEYDPSVKQIRY